MPRRNNGPKLVFLAKRRTFYVCWTEGGRSRQRSTGTRDRKAAEIAFARFIIARTRLSGAPRDPNEVLITDLLATYAQERGQDVIAPERLAYAIEALCPFWEGKFTSNIDRTTCRDYVRSRGRANGTIRRELGVLRAAVNHAHRQGRLTRPVAVLLPEAPLPRERWLSRQEAAKLLASAMTEPRVRTYLPLFILLALYTGQRKNTILQLRWSQVDLSAKRIDFRAAQQAHSNKRRPKIPIPTKLFGHLTRARRRGTEFGFVLNIDGERIADLKKSFAAACRKAQLTKVTPHTLRHTCATWLMQAGVESWEACGFLGMSRETLENVYGHHSPEFLQKAARALS